MSRHDEPEGEDLNESEIETLNALIRTTPTEEPARPDDTVLSAYVCGRATREEVRLVQRAMAKSESLRQEVLYLTELMNPTAHDRATARPQVESVLTNGNHSGRATREQITSISPDIKPRRIWSNRLLLGGLIPAALIALAVLLPRLNSQSPWVEQDRLFLLQLTPERLRGDSEPESSPAPTNPREAATSAFRNSVEWDGKEFRFTLTASSPPGKAISANIAGTTYVGTVPETADFIELWFLGLPSLQMRRLELQEDAKISWPTRDRRGAVTIVYHTEEGFGASWASEVVRR